MAALFWDPVQTEKGILSAALLGFYMEFMMQVCYSVSAITSCFKKWIGMEEPQRCMRTGKTIMVAYIPKV